MRILIAEDEKRLANALRQILTEKKYMVDVVFDGKDALAYVKSGIYDLVILDIMLPYMNGFEVISAMRKENLSTPVLMLTARDSISDKVKGLEMGADDYMTKPFSTEELLARIRVLTRRRGEMIMNEMHFHDIVFYLDRAELSCTSTSKNIKLSFKESEMLKLFLSRPESVLTKEELITKIWGYDSDASDNNVEAYISFLRKKLHFVGSEVQIVSKKKIGYKFEAPLC
ncbi:MAG: response regulator transcription factor [Clostridia bacterium]|nr:response regulator transcription factor [Clostridia bacterium]